MTATHLHLALNHVPVLGMGFSTMLLAIGTWRGSREVVRIALLFLALSAASAIPVYLTGEPAERGVKGLPAVSERLMEQHADLSPIALAATLAAGVGAAFALGLSRAGRGLHRGFVLGILAIAIASAGLLVATANLGGKIRHSEIRPATPAAP